MGEKIEALQPIRLPLQHLGPNTDESDRIEMLYLGTVMPQKERWKEKWLNDQRNKVKRYIIFPGFIIFVNKFSSQILSF